MVVRYTLALEEGPGRDAALRQHLQAMVGSTTPLHCLSADRDTLCPRVLGFVRVADIRYVLREN